MTTRGLKDMKEEWAGCVKTAYRVLYETMLQKKISKQDRQELIHLAEDLEKAVGKREYYATLHDVCVRNGYLGVKPDNTLIKAAD